MHMIHTNTQKKLVYTNINRMRLVLTGLLENFNFILCMCLCDQHCLNCKYFSIRKKNSLIKESILAKH